MKRQFIAGATCPECGQMDKIQRVIDGDSQWMESVSYTHLTLPTKREG